jgi:hypothetical protein
VPGAVTPPPGLLPAQEDAYRACLGRGLWLVWGPPGTGKTRVLRSAVGDLMAAGKRILLVSGTNIAVDNALEMNRRRERLQDLEARLAGFEPAAYDAAVNLLAEPGCSAAETGSALARYELQAENGLRAIEDARRDSRRRPRLPPKRTLSGLCGPR